MHSHSFLVRLDIRMRAVCRKTEARMSLCVSYQECCPQSAQRYMRERYARPELSEKDNVAKMSGRTIHSPCCRILSHLQSSAENRHLDLPNQLTYKRLYVGYDLQDNGVLYGSWWTGRTFCVSIPPAVSSVLSSISPSWPNRTILERHLWFVSS